MVEHILKGHSALVNARQITLEVLDVQLKRAFLRALNTPRRLVNDRYVDGRFNQPFFNGEIVTELQNIARRLISNPLLFEYEPKHPKYSGFEKAYITDEVILE